MMTSEVVLSDAEVGRALKYERERRDLSLASASGLTGIPKSTLDRYEHGYPITFANLQRASRAYGYPDVGGFVHAAAARRSFLTYVA